jgi:hypothetical protein
LPQILDCQRRPLAESVHLTRKTTPTCSHFFSAQLTINCGLTVDNRCTTTPDQSTCPLFSLSRPVNLGSWTGDPLLLILHPPKSEHRVQSPDRLQRCQSLNLIKIKTTTLFFAASAYPRCHCSRSQFSQDLSPLSLLYLSPLPAPTSTTGCVHSFLPSDSPLYASTSRPSP